ncbi:MAG: penicillin-insensitive murein endopeptidase [Myxococcales bacterium]|nr:penicillin-insensitive murein endopeptidase [Myxococcales bacterium]
MNGLRLSAPSPWRCWLAASLLLAIGLVGCSKKGTRDKAAPNAPSPVSAPKNQPQSTQAPSPSTPTDLPADAIKAASTEEPRGAVIGNMPTGPVTDPQLRFDRARALDRNASRSVGTPQTGHLVGGVSLASLSDPHLRFLYRTAKKHTLYGTVELVTLVRDAAAAVAREHPGIQLTVGNLSRLGGGDISASVSHNSGRDADLSFYLLDAAGKSVRWPTMLHCDDTGVVRKPAAARGFRFDTDRNWTLVRHLLSHPAVVVQWIFVAAPLRNMLLDHALRIGEPALLRKRALRVLVQPSDSSRHDDHFHVRIACPPGDKPGCRSGPGRTRLARETQIDSLLHMYHRGSPAEQRYARELLSVPVDGSDLVLPPMEEHGPHKP